MKFSKKKITEKFDLIYKINLVKKLKGLFKIKSFR